MRNKNKKLVTRGSYCHWQPKERKTKIKTQHASGSMKVGFVVFSLFFVIGAAYLYSVNSNAVKGYEIREVEKEISELRKNQEQLKIREAELNSLYRIERESENLNMAELGDDVAYIEELGPVAFK